MNNENRYYDYMDNEDTNMIRTLKNIYEKNILQPYKNSNKRIDLHTYTKFSGGDLLPHELVNLAIEKHIGTLAITDINTIDGLKELELDRGIIKDSGINIIKGIELCSKIDDQNINILGYGLDIENKYLNKKMIELQDKNINAIISILDYLRKEFNISFSYETIKELINSEYSLSKYDIAKLCVKYKYASSINEALNKYLVNTNKFIEKLNFEECLEIISKCGGIAVLANPKYLTTDQNKLSEIIEKLIKYGLKGLEIENFNYSIKDINFYENIANKYHLLTSGGSGFRMLEDENLGCQNIKSLTITKKL